MNGAGSRDASPDNEAIPLALYVHLPWCVRKCPYCDFNSHEAADRLPERQYVDALLADLEGDLPRVWGRRLSTVFIGGGTPSLFAPEALDRLLAGIRARLPLPPDAEITLEANPGTVEAGRFSGYREAGINRLSLGVQSFDDGLLRALGRIHGAREARLAIDSARKAGFENINLDLMYGLPGQSVADAVRDVREALSREPDHLSHYQLTLEPNTRFHRQPPHLPDGDTVASMLECCQAEIARAGHGRYEVSAYARPGYRCRHNLNYWTFGDYIGTGAGAHGKLTGPAHEEVVRTSKHRHPRDYLERKGNRYLSREWRLTDADRTLEFMMNAMRLMNGVPASMFRARTGIGTERVTAQLQEARRKGLLASAGDRLQPTALGRRFLNDLLAVFLPG